MASTIPYRTLGKTGETVSAIGLGGWHLGLERVDELATRAAAVRNSLPHGYLILPRALFGSGRRARIAFLVRSRNIEPKEAHETGDVPSSGCPETRSLVWRPTRRRLRRSVVGNEPACLVCSAKPVGSNPNCWR